MEVKNIGKAVTQENAFYPEDQRLLVDFFGVLLEWAIEDGKNDGQESQKLKDKHAKRIAEDSKAKK